MNFKIIKYIISFTIVSLFVPISQAKYSIYYTYELVKLQEYRDKPHLNPLQGSLLANYNALINLYNYTDKGDPFGDLTRFLFNSVDGVNITPSKSNQSIATQISIEFIGAILAATLEFEKKIKTSDESLNDFFLNKFCLSTQQTKKGKSAKESSLINTCRKLDEIASLKDAVLNNLNF